MRTSRSLRPRLDGMEPRALMSGVVGVASALAVAPAHHTIHLDGTAKGTYNEHQFKPDTPKVYDLFGAGDVGLKARTALTGGLEAGGFTSNSQAHGTIFLADAHGTITLKLTADKAGGSTGGLADQYDYTVVGGTGIYKGDDGHGSIVLTLDKGKAPTTVGASQHGTFSMAFVG